MNLHEIIEFMNAQRLMTLSTVHDDGRPQAAVVQFAVLPKGALLFTTSDQSRKFANLLANGRVACVIGWDEKVTVQLEGMAERVPEAEVPELKAVYLEQNPGATKLTARADMVLFKIEPAWVRYADYASEPWQLYAFDFAQEAK